MKKSNPAGIIFIRKDPRNNNNMQILLGREKRWRETPGVDSKHKTCYSKFVYTCAFGKCESCDMSIADTAIRETDEEHPGILTPDIENMIRNHKVYSDNIQKHFMEWKVDDENKWQHGWCYSVLVNDKCSIGKSSTKDCPLPNMRWHSVTSLPYPLNFPAYTMIGKILQNEFKIKT